MPSSPRRPHGAPLAFVQPAFSSQAGSLILAAPAKLNLFLEITGKRPDGYHNIETLMVSVDLFDTLELQANTTGTITLECDPPGLPTSSDNLVVKAAEKLKAACGFAARDLGASVRLTKRIPTQAGLAGGSSDAAATILGLNRLWNLNLSKFELANVAADVGSDVAFFLDLPAAWCTGRGEIVVPELLQTTLHFVLVCPPVGLGTADVYRALPPLAASQTMPAEKTQAALRSADLVTLGASLFNRLQAPAFGLAPLVESVYRRLRSLNPAGCLMSGSGSSVFALCRDRADAVRVAAAFLEQTPAGEPESRVLVVRSLCPIAPA